MPAPMAPWMSASEALTICMLRTAMKAPSVAASTATQVLVETVGEAGAAACGVVGAGADEAAFKAGWSVVIGVSSWLAERGCIRRRISIIRQKVGRIIRQALTIACQMLASVRARRTDVLGQM